MATLLHWLTALGPVLGRQKSDKAQPLLPETRFRFFSPRLLAGENRREVMIVIRRRQCIPVTDHPPIHKRIVPGAMYVSDGNTAGIFPGNQIVIRKQYLLALDQFR